MMTIWVPDLAGQGGPRYLALAEAIAGAIARGELRPGDRLPPQRTLAWRLGVTTGTVGRAYAVAASRGLLAGEVGRGTYVRAPEGSGGGFSVLPPPREGGIADLGVNTAILPWQEEHYARTLAAVAASPGIGDAVRYMPTAGLARHREGIARWLRRRGISTEPDRILLTCGAQHGLALAVAVLTAPGQAVMVEALTYPGLLGALSLMHRKVEPLAMDAEGALPESLDRAAHESGARVAFLQPSLQNPTAAVMSEARRRDILAVARARDLLLVEDDIYGSLLADGPPPLHALDPERVVYVSSASKCLAPGLRCGWTVAPGNLVMRLAEAAFATAVTQGATHFEVLHRWIEEGIAEEITAGLRKEVTARQEIAARVLAGLETVAHPASFHLLLHLPEPWRGGTFADAAGGRGVRVVAASAFAARPATAPRAVRVSISGAETREKLETALGLLKAIIEEGDGGARGVI